jgi:hypothetical protein
MSPSRSLGESVTHAVLIINLVPISHDCYAGSHRVEPRGYSVKAGTIYKPFVSASAKLGARKISGQILIDDVVSSQNMFRPGALQQGFLTWIEA